MSNWQISRRRALRGLGVTLGLPLLDAMSPVVSGAAGSGTESVPKRMAFIFVPNGVEMSSWTPQEDGDEFQLPPVLQPVSDSKDDLLVLTGLTHDKGRANGDAAGDHARCASVFLTGAQPLKSADKVRAGVSVDQYAAQQIGHATLFPSLQLGCERGRDAGSCDSGYSCAYSNNISWAGARSPVSKEVNPRQVFERLFTRPADENAKRQFFRRSILDFVADDAKQLSSKLGQADRRKLDEYLGGVREVEQRLQRPKTVINVGPQVAGRFPQDVPGDYSEHLRLMCDLMVLAFQTDSTRIITCMFANAGSNKNYRFIGVPNGHHELSHHGGDAQKIAKIRQINTFHTEQFAYLLRQLKTVREGEGSLLDHSMILYGSGISDGNRHNNENLPVLLAGRGGGTITPGRHLRYTPETPMNNLFLSMLDRVGASTDWLGDSTGRLPDLQV